MMIANPIILQELTSALSNKEKEVNKFEAHLQAERDTFDSLTNDQKRLHSLFTKVSTRINRAKKAGLAKWEEWQGESLFFTGDLNDWGPTIAPEEWVEVTEARERLFSLEKNIKGCIEALTVSKNKIQNLQLEVKERLLMLDTFLVSIKASLGEAGLIIVKAAAQSGKKRKTE